MKYTQRKNEIHKHMVIKTIIIDIMELDININKCNLINN